MTGTIPPAPDARQGAAPLRIGLVGHGAIGRRLASLIAVRPETLALSGVLVRDRAAAFARDPALAAPVFDRLDDLLATHPDWIVECAGHHAVDACAIPALEAGCGVLLVSVGALADDARLAALTDAARRTGRPLRWVPGAVGGLDWLGAAATAGLDEVVYRGSKPPAAWRGTDAERTLDLDALVQAACFFRGSAREAARRYPRNANVAATVALAGVGADRTVVELWADPASGGNRHEVRARGAAGEMSIRIDNLADPDNPRTSLITAHSALHVLLGLTGTPAR
jgi:aspartate dehydrogenase